MRQRPWEVSFLGPVALILLALVVGCAKRPVSVTPGAPETGGPAPSTAGAPAPGVSTMPGAKVERAPGASGPSRGVTPGASGSVVTPPGPLASRRVPSEFTSIPALKDVHFDFDKYDIRPEDAKIVEENAKWMKVNSTYLILVEWHCDERGTSEYNLALGERRAKATMNKYGSYAPVAQQSGVPEGDR